KRGEAARRPGHGTGIAFVDARRERAENAPARLAPPMAAGHEQAGAAAQALDRLCTDRFPADRRPAGPGSRSPEPAAARARVAGVLDQGRPVLVGPVGGAVRLAEHMGGVTVAAAHFETGSADMDAVAPGPGPEHVESRIFGRQG